MSAPCDPGETVTGGGFFYPEAADNIKISASAPFGTTAWSVSIENESNGDLTLTVYAMCAS